MSTTTTRLLQAAAEIAGGKEAVARRLGITEALLADFMADRLTLPDTLLLRTVDIILEDRARHRPLQAVNTTDLLLEVGDNWGSGGGTPKLKEVLG